MEKDIFHGRAMRSLIEKVSTLSTRPRKRESHREKIIFERG